MWKPLLFLTLIVTAVLRADFATEAGSLKRGQSGRSQNPSPLKESPLDLDQIKELIKDLPDTAIAGLMVKRGINFKLDEETINGLKSVGAGPQTLQVLRTFMSNRQPSVQLQVDKSSVMLGQSITMTAVVKDPDGDELQHRWVSNAGRIKGDGLTVELDTSEIDLSVGQLQVTVTITVSDLKGGFASDSKSVTILSSQAEAKTSSDRRENISPQEPSEEMVLESASEGKDTLITLSGSSGTSSTSPLGSIEVRLKLNNGIVEVKSLTGKLPGVQCRLAFTGIKNVSKGSFKETPDRFNLWSKVIVRFRIKDPKQEVHFVIGWEVLDR
jgi:hypothetical protein